MLKIDNNPLKGLLQEALTEASDASVAKQLEIGKKRQEKYLARLAKQQAKQTQEDDEEAALDRIVLPSDPEVRFHHDPKPEPEFKDGKIDPIDGIPVEFVDGKYTMVAQEEDPRIVLKSSSYNKVLEAYNDLWDLPYGEHRRWALEHGEYDMNSVNATDSESEVTFDDLPINYEINEAIRKAIEKFLR